MSKTSLLFLALFASASALAAEPLSLNDAQRIALARAPQIAAASARGDAAREMAVAAGQRPDPVLKIGVNSVPISGPNEWSVNREAMSTRSISLMQQLTRSDKLDARRSRSEREADIARSLELRARADAARDTALAWLELSYLQRIHTLISAQIEEVGHKRQASEAAFRAGSGPQADVFALRSEAARLGLQVSSLEGEIAAARARLARWLGSQPGELAAAPDISQLAWALPLGEDDSALQAHPTLAAAASRVELAEAEAQLARSQRKADPTVELMFSQRGAAYANMISLNVSIPLQWQQGQRQDRELAARLASAEQLRAEQEDARRAYRAELAARHAAWQSALQRARQYETELIPLAEQQAQAALADYRAGSGMLMRVLEARRATLDTRLQAQRVQLEAARAWAQLNFLNPVAAESEPAPQGKQS